MAQMHGKYVLLKLKQKKPEAQKAQKEEGKEDNSQGISNPRYYENAHTVKKAGIKRELGKVNDLSYF